MFFLISFSSGLTERVTTPELHTQHLKNNTFEEFLQLAISHSKKKLNLHFKCLLTMASHEEAPESISTELHTLLLLSALAFNKTVP